MSEPSGRSILLFAFLREIKQKDKKAFAVVIMCMLLQLLFTLIKLEATPFFLFGMYSEKMVHTDTISRVRVLFNEQSLESFSMPMREKDLLETTAMNYIDIRYNNNTDVVRTRIESRYPFIHQSPLYPLFADRIYNTEADLAGYKKWLKSKRTDITTTDSGVIRIVKTTYLLNPSTLNPTVLNNEVLDVF